ncbi:MAG TPA: Na+/H+ antiporter NhaA, partial [Chitinophagaceae bacterium]
IISLVISNLGFGEAYAHLWHADLGGRSVEFWINDGLMTVFFLLVGLEIEREIYAGELNTLKQAMLPVMAALGGMLLPGLFHFLLNMDSPTRDGFGIPMATDIAFSLAILSLLGRRVPGSLKVFLTALAIIDDLGAIMIIAIFYSKAIVLLYLGGAALIFALLLVLNRLRMHKVWIYLVIGVALWYCLYRSGIHPTVTGVLLAFAVPFGNGDENSPSYGLQHKLHSIVAFAILPLFALANTAIVIPPSFANDLLSWNSLGIFAGLLLGKPVGILLFSMLGIALGLCTLPEDLKKRHLFGAGILAGIGFTMSIFITLLAFTDPDIIIGSKIAVLIASLLAGVFGYLWLNMVLGKRGSTEVSKLATEEG